MRPKDGSVSRRRIKVRCVFCGVSLGRLAGDYVQAWGVCRTCVFRESGGPVHISVVVNKVMAELQQVRSAQPSDRI